MLKTAIPINKLSEHINKAIMATVQGAYPDIVVRITDGQVTVIDEQNIKVSVGLYLVPKDASSPAT